MDRRTSIKWVLVASAVWPMAAQRGGYAATAPVARGYGTDPDLGKVYHPGEVWPLTLTASQKRLAKVLADIIIPADAHSPSASAVGVVEFIDEWVSAPYPANQIDRPVVLNGLAWMDAEAMHRFRKAFADLELTQQHRICDDICDPSRATPGRRDATRFFALYRDLTAGGFYSSPLGRKDLGYIGNVPLERFDGPPPELLRKVNLA